jgi:hypothetical protein
MFTDAPASESRLESKEAIPAGRKTGFSDEWMLSVVRQGAVTFSVDSKSPVRSPTIPARPAGKY